MAPVGQPGDKVSAHDVSTPLERGAFTQFEADGVERSARVIGLPGEKVEVSAGVVLIDGDADVDVWASSPVRGADYSVTLGPNEYFMMPDNRAQSQDSRLYGPVPKDAVQLTASLPAPEEVYDSPPCGP